MAPTTVDEHRARAAAEEASLLVAVITASDTRTVGNDASGSYLTAAILDAGHALGGYRLVRDEADEITAALDELADLARVIVVTGGTGLSRRDVTVDAVAAKLDRTLPGFGELFRMLSYQEIGAAAMLSRAVAGAYRDVVVFCLPGSPDAVRLAWEKLIAPELRHLVRELSR